MACCWRFFLCGSIINSALFTCLFFLVAILAQPPASSQPLPHRAVEHDRGEQQQAGVAVRFEDDEAQRRVGDIEAIHGRSADRNTAGTRVASPGARSAFGRNPENICSRELFAF